MLETSFRADSKIPGEALYQRLDLLVDGLNVRVGGEVGAAIGVDLPEDSEGFCAAD